MTDLKASGRHGKGGTVKINLAGIARGLRDRLLPLGLWLLDKFVFWVLLIFFLAGLFVLGGGAYGLWTFWQLHQPTVSTVQAPAIPTPTGVAIQGTPPPGLLDKDVYDILVRGATG